MTDASSIIIEPVRSKNRTEIFVGVKDIVINLLYDTVINKDGETILADPAISRKMIS